MSVDSVGLCVQISKSDPPYYHNLREISQITIVLVDRRRLAQY
jgi:hypothetical protein